MTVQRDEKEFVVGVLVSPRVLNPTLPRRAPGDWVAAESSLGLALSGANAYL